MLSATLASTVPGAGAIADLGGQTMGTTWSARLVLPCGVALAQAHAGVQRALDQVVAQMSTWLPGSDICRLNRAPAGWHAVPAELFTVLHAACELARDTDGAYDPSAGPLVDLWGFGPRSRGPHLPDAAQIAAARARVDWRRLRLDAGSLRVWQPGGAELDLSSIAKGYGVDQAAQTLERLGVAHYLVEVGGELRGRGRRPDGHPWRVAVELPDDAGMAAVLPLDGWCVATSGDYRRYFDAGGTRHSHTIDPRTGRPVAHALASVTVAHASCMQADALATALTVLGPEAGMAHARRRGLAALFVSRSDTGFETAATPAFDALREKE